MVDWTPTGPRKSPTPLGGVWRGTQYNLLPPISHLDHRRPATVEGAKCSSSSSIAGDGGELFGSRQGTPPSCLPIQRRMRNKRSNSTSLEAMHQAPPHNHHHPGFYLAAGEITGMCGCNPVRKASAQRMPQNRSVTTACLPSGSEHTSDDLQPFPQGRVLRRMWRKDSEHYVECACRTTCQRTSGANVMTSYHVT